LIHRVFLQATDFTCEKSQILYKRDRGLPHRVEGSHILLGKPDDRGQEETGKKKVLKSSSRFADNVFDRLSFTCKKVLDMPVDP